jgi:redox-sensitive bicupin YhaK (pirin superfamily)
MLDPFYKNLKGTSIPAAVTDSGAEVRVISGMVRKPGTGVVEGPLTALGVVYMDVEVPADTSFTMEVGKGWRTLVYNFGGPPGFREGAWWTEVSSS